VVPADSDRVSRARPYSGTRRGRLCAFVYGTIALCGATFQSLRLTHNFVTSRPAGRRIMSSPTTPDRQRLPPITSIEFGLFPVRSPLLRESRFLSFPRATKMFQFARLPLRAYVFSTEYARITTRRFPHSEIPGSKVGQHLPRAYRSRPRPSSAPGAKASTVCPCSLDQKRTRVDVAMEFSRCARDGARGDWLQPVTAAHRAVSQNSTACRRGRRCSRNQHRTSDDIFPGATAGKACVVTGRAGPTGVMAPASLERR
jgi:hypothetical protein